jgi:serine/threonine protein kinase
MPLDDFIIEKELGKGSFGTVHQCKRKADGQTYAIKQVLTYLNKGSHGQAQIEGSH